MSPKRFHVFDQQKKNENRKERMREKQQKEQKYIVYKFEENVKS